MQEEAKKKVVRNKTAKILYSIYSVVFAALAIGCYVLFQSAYIQIDVDVCSFPTMVLYYLGVGVLFYGILAVLAITHAVVSSCAKKEHDYLRISGKWLLLVVLILTPVVIMLSGQIGHVNYIYDARMVEPIESEYTLNNPGQFDKYAYSADQADEGSIQGVTNKFAMVMDMDQDLKEEDTFDATFRYSKYPAFFQKMETWGDDDLMETSGQEQVSKQICDGYTLYTCHSPETEDDAEHTTVSLVVQTDCVYFLADLETYNSLSDKKKKQFVDNSLRIYHAFLAQAESL